VYLRFVNRRRCKQARAAFGVIDSRGAFIYGNIIKEVRRFIVVDTEVQRLPGVHTGASIS